jgi:histidinol dehydrogenase
MIRFLKKSDQRFAGEIERIVKRGERDFGPIEDAVRKILYGVKEGGDNSLVRYTKEFDGVDVKPSELALSRADLENALDQINPEIEDALQLAYERIERFHKKQVSESWTVSEEGILLGQKVSPLERVGIYVPGGKALYPSTVLMNAVPPKVAGVKEIVMVTPPQAKGISHYTLAAAHIAGVDRVYRVGGVQAIGALAYGTETIPQVDKIVGPGNIYVATAKRLVYGVVDIDMVAGPSEVLIVNDGTGNPAYIASDLLSQAEHDEMASSIFITTSPEMADEVNRELKSQLEKLRRIAIIEESLKNYGAIILVDNMDDAFDIANRIAPEHLEIIADNAERYLDKVKNAGAIFLGENTPEAIGDYIAGPNHVLPTGGSARFFSVLGVEDFMKRSSILSFDKNAIARLGRQAVELAEIEDLEAHAQSVAIRLKS